MNRIISTDKLTVDVSSSATHLIKIPLSENKAPLCFHDLRQMATG